MWQYVTERVVRVSVNIAREAIRPHARSFLLGRNRQLVVFENPNFGPPTRTHLSTNVTCQLETTRNWTAKRWPPTRTLGVRVGFRQSESTTGGPPSTREMLGIAPASGRDAVNENAQAIQGSGRWLPTVDSHLLNTQLAAALLQPSIHRLPPSATNRPPKSRSGQPG